MNTNFISKIISGCFLLLILVSCESREQKTDDAFERVKEEKMMSKDSNNISKKIIQNTKPEPSNKNVRVGQGNSDEWLQFRMETENKILRNEKMIKAIKIIPAEDSGLLLYRKVIRLEKENNDLRRQMDEYNEEMKVRWENFKMKMDHDANEIAIELKDIKTSNKN